METDRECTEGICPVPMFGTMKLVDASLIEVHLRNRLGQRRRVHRKAGVVELGIIKPTTVHQEFRVLRRVFSVAVKKKFCLANPCAAVEFPVRVKGLFRPHYMKWSEQLKIEGHAPAYLRNVIRIITETGLQVYKKLASLKKEQVDLEISGVHSGFEDSDRSGRSPAN